MFEDKVERIKSWHESLDVKVASRLSIEQFGNLLCVLSDKGLIDTSQEGVKIQGQIEACYSSLLDLMDEEVIGRKESHGYIKKYNALLNEVKTAFYLEPTGSIQNRLLGLGIAIGTGIGMALSVANPSMITIGIGLGLAIGASIGKKKEREAKEAGKLF